VEAPAGSLSRKEAARLVNARPWPSFVVNELMEIIAGNRTGLLLAGLNRQRMANRVERNVLVIASRIVSTPSNEQVRDWGVAARLAIARVKAAGAASIEAPDAYHAAVLERIARGDARLVRELTRLWDATPPHMPRPSPGTTRRTGRCRTARPCGCIAWPSASARETSPRSTTGSPPTPNPGTSSTATSQRCTGAGPERHMGASCTP